MNERGEQPGFVPSNEGGNVSRGPLEQSLPPEMKIEGVEATIIPEPQVPSSESTPTPEVGADVIANLEQKLAAQRVAQCHLGSPAPRRLETSRASGLHPHR